MDKLAESTVHEANSERTGNSLGCQRRTASKPFPRCLFELELESDSQISAKHNQGHGAKDDHQTELPAYSNSQNRACDDVDYVDTDQHKIKAKKLEQVPRIVGEVRRQGSSGICRIVEERHILLQDQIKDLSRVSLVHIDCDNVARPANGGKYSQVANCDDEEHKGIEVALLYATLRTKLKGFYYTREQDCLRGIGRTCVCQLRDGMSRRSCNLPPAMTAIARMTKHFQRLPCSLRTMKMHEIKLWLTPSFTLR